MIWIARAEKNTASAALEKRLRYAKAGTVMQHGYFFVPSDPRQSR